MKRKTILKSMVLPALLAGGILFSGCSSDNEVRMNGLQGEKAKMLYSLDKYRKATLSDVNAPSERLVHLNLRNKWVHSAVKKVARGLHYPFDKTFIPSTEYKVSMKFDGSIKEFFDIVYRQTGVQYIIEDGMIRINNLELVEEFHKRNTKCSAKKRFEVSLKNAPIRRVFAYFTEQKGYNVIFDTRYFELENTRSSKKPFPLVSFHYKGCDAKDALMLLAKQNDLKITFKRGSKEAIVRDYDTLEVSVPTYYNVRYNSDSGTVGNNQAKGGVSLSETDNFNGELEKMISTFMSKNGKAFLSKRGHLVIEDTPKTVKKLRKVLNKEMYAQQNINLDITILSVDLADEFKSGVDWNYAFEELGKDLGIRNFTMGTSALTGEANAFTVGGIVSNKSQLLEVFGHYGNTKLVKEYHLSTKSGIQSVLKMVENIPYVTTKTIIDNGIAQVEKEAKSVDAGLVLNLKPTIQKNRLNIAMDILLSQYLGDKQFGDDFVLPRIASNRIQAPMTIPFGKTTILTGLSLNKNSLSYDGIPHGQRTGILSTLLGKNADGGEIKEFLIFITPYKFKK